MASPARSRLIVEIDGMQTVHCVRAVFTALAGVEGIIAADVERGRATIDHDGRASDASVRAAVALAGYAVRALYEQRRGLPVL